MANGLDSFIEQLKLLGFKALVPAAQSFKSDFYINLAATEAQVYFDGYIQLSQFNGCLVVCQQAKVLLLVLNDINTNDKVNEQFDKFNLLFYAMRQYSEEKTAKYTAEVLLLAENEKNHARLNRYLNELASESKILHQIGANTLLSDEITLLAVKKVMPWQLSFYKEWWDKAPHNNQKNKIYRLRQNNYRLKGQREIKFVDEGYIHLVHGHNGSGKSALAETIELWLTGKVQRLKGHQANDYWKHVVNHDSKEKKAQIFCYLDDKALKKPTITIDEGYCIEEVKCQNTSFGLNQDFIDGLSRTSARERLALLESAFFNNNRLNIKKYDEYQEKSKPLIALLSDKFKCNNTLEAVLVRLNRLKGTEENELLLQHCLPISKDSLVVLLGPGKDSSDLLEQLYATKSLQDMGEILRQIGIRLKRVIPLEQAKQARQILIDLKDWKLSGEASDLSYEQLFANWSENQARIALLEKRLILSKVYEGVILYSDNTPDTDLTQLHLSNNIQLSLSHKKEVEQLLKQLKGLSNKIEQQLDADTINTQKSNSEAHDSKLLTAGEKRLLDNVGSHLVDNDKETITQLGKALSEALTHQLTSDVANSLNMAKIGWTKPLLIQLESLIESLEQWEKAIDTGISDKFGLESWCECYQEALSVLEQYQVLKTQKEQRFLEQFKGDNNLMVNALNELLSLFTPSRWLYDDLKISDDGRELKLIVNNGELNNDASLLWNTAKLNLVSISLFLLCANYQPHQRPVNTLIMDDPLQNMDELTITYLARGLAKIAYCVELNNFTHLNQLILLFHGEQAMTKFSEEVPAAVYSLPWRNENNITKIESEEKQASYKRMNYFDFEGKFSFED